MPSVSEKQRRLMAMAEHNPEKVSKKNKGVLKMSKKQLHEFASKAEPEPHPWRKEWDHKS